MEAQLAWWGRRVVVNGPQGFLMVGIQRAGEKGASSIAQSHVA